ncbi:diguanylate cyclase [Actinoplanes rectilineatus]|uniref:diguanylate cyclase n=1 Tax=Actinoplanes rectilineatus TaxID=113571 RepID=UPI0014706AFE|nr:diguanylate cyclase [Actinoplanes rectilineatus]
MLHDSDRTHVVRLRLADGTRVVRKRPLGPRAPERLRTELAALRRLQDLPGVPVLAPAGHPGTLTVLDADARTLADMPVPWPAGPLVDLALHLAEVLAGVHRRGVVHRDVSPANILIGADGRPTLIDFELAVLPARDRDEPVAPGEPAGTLPYLAPEQTGRTGQAVDHRADLYALGATLYELATGAPPFGRDREPLDLIHDHLARVPTPPAETVPGLPAALSGILLRLLHKEPGRRYQSGEGLAHDLETLRRHRRAGDTAGFPLGDRDFPLRLAPPQRLIGRETQLGALHGLLREVTGGHSVLALLTGPPGSGKTALVERLRPAVTAAGGWFTAGKFDQFRAGDPVREAFDRLGDLLLAEPDDVLAGLRTRLLDALSPEQLRAALVLLPSMRGLLGAEPDRGEEIAFSHVLAAASTVLRTVASAARPVVFVVDDLQWATTGALAFLDEVLDRRDLAGVLVLGAYRTEDVDEAHPLSALRARLRRDRGTSAEIVLADLGPDDLTTLVAEMLRLPADRAAPLAALLAERTGGNPFDTVELLDALRRDGELLPRGGGWEWDTTAVRRFVGHGDVVDLLGTRIEALPVPARELLEIMSCLGAAPDTATLAVASGRDPARITATLLPAITDGLLATHADGVAFRHDRVQQAAHERIAPDERAELNLTLARRFAAQPGYAPAAAAHYLAAVPALRVPENAVMGEKPAAADLLRRAASAARLIANHAGAQACLAGALSLLEKTDAGYAETRAEWHAALCALSRFAEADRVYAEIAAGTAPEMLAASTAHQIDTLFRRGLADRAVALGLDLLAALGAAVPGPDRIGPATADGLTAFHQWLAARDDDAPIPELADPRLLAIAEINGRLVLATAFGHHVTAAWLVADSARMWSTAGACAALARALAYVGWVTIGGGGTYRSAYTGVRHILTVAGSRGYEPETSLVKLLHATSTAPWFEPFDATVRLVHEARDGLLRGGDPHTALYTHYPALTQTADSATLDTLDQEVRAALAMADRVGADKDRTVFTAFARLGQAVRDGTDNPPDDFDEDTFLTTLTGDGLTAAVYLTYRALAAAVLGDDTALTAHTAALPEAMTRAPGTSMFATSHLLVALGVQAGTGTLHDLDTGLDFLAARADDQPGNYRHLHLLATATRAALTGDVPAAEQAYDAAMAATDGTGAGWHRPLIYERAARFYRGRGLHQVAHGLLDQARDGYARWGATGKVRLLDRECPELAGTGPAPTRTTTVHSGSLSSEDIDLMAVLEAARALSSETALDQLQTRVQHILSRMTGATAVHLIVRDDRDDGWILPGSSSPGDGIAPTAEQLPLTAIRYAERTGEPLLVDDAARDDRVARDPYLAGLDHCSLLVVPIPQQGRAGAMLLLENRLSRRAFSTGRLDAVRLIAGQLTVSLENTRLYTWLERKVAERTEELAEANHRLELLTVTDPLTGLPNRRRLDAFLAAECARAARTGDPIGVLMIDIDHFKTYNDHYGHQAGDACLRRVAETLLSCVRDSDLVARYGGEEFCVVLPGIPVIAVLNTAERLCHAVAELTEPHALAATGIVTVSVGATTGTTAGPGQLTKLADEALYEAKRTGRNRVAVRSEELPF